MKTKIHEEYSVFISSHHRPLLGRGKEGRKGRRTWGKREVNKERGKEIWERSKGQGKREGGGEGERERGGGRKRDEEGGRMKEGRGEWEQE